jgi:hypothetical protein
MGTGNGIRRVDLGDETLLLDAARGRVVRLRGVARATLDGSDGPDARAVRDHLATLGVELDTSDVVGMRDAPSGLSRRTLLSASAAAALGVTVMALPTAGAAATVGGSGSAQPTGFVQVGEIFTVGVAPSTTEIGSITRSFSHDGFIHLLDESSWTLYVLPATLETAGTRAIDLSAAVQTWEAGTSTDFVVDVASDPDTPDYAYIASTYMADATPTPYVKVVRLKLPIAPDVTQPGEVTVWTTSLAAGGPSGRTTKNLLNDQWSFPGAVVDESWEDEFEDPRLIPGSELQVETPSIRRVTETEPFDLVGDLTALVLLDGTLYGVVRFDSPINVNLSVTVTKDLGEGEGETEYRRGNFRIVYWELVRIPTSGAGAGVAVVKVLGETATWTPLRNAFNSGEVLAQDSLDLSYIRPLAVVAGGLPVFVGEDWWQVSEHVALTVASPSGVTPTATVAALGPWSDYSTALGFSSSRPGWVRIGTDLFLAGETGDEEDEEEGFQAGLIHISLADATLPITAFLPIPGAYETYGPVATDGSNIFIVFGGDVGDEFGTGVAWFEPGGGTTWTFRAAALIGAGSFSDDHDPFTAQPWGSGISGVLTAARFGSVPIATFRFVAPPS